VRRQHRQYLWHWSRLPFQVRTLRLFIITNVICSLVLSRWTTVANQSHWTRNKRRSNTSTTCINHSTHIDHLIISEYVHWGCYLSWKSNLHSCHHVGQSISFTTMLWYLQNWFLYVQIAFVTSQLRRIINISHLSECTLLTSIIPKLSLQIESIAEPITRISHSSTTTNADHWNL